MQVMRRELEVPLLLARLRIEREHRVRVQVVALALVAVVVGTRIAGRPIQQPCCGIVAAGEPGSSASVFECLAVPGIRSGLTARGHGPESPDTLAGSCSVGVEETADAFVST